MLRKLFQTGSMTMAGAQTLQRRGSSTITKSNHASSQSSPSSSSSSLMQAQTKGKAKTTRAPMRNKVALVVLGLIVLWLSTFHVNPSTSGVRKKSNLAKVEDKNDIKLEKISVVLMNHGRPMNIKKSKLMPTLLESDLIGEVLLLHSNPETAFQYNHSKVKNVPAVEENDTHGLSIRFWFCAQKAAYPWVIHVDDDMEFPVETLEAIVHEFALDPDRVVGRYGRALNYFIRTGPIASGYNSYNYPGESEVVLTKLMIMPQKVCRYFHEYEPLVKEYVDANSHPRWNGEDIWMSLVTNHVYNHGIVQPTNKHDYAEKPHKNYAMPWLQIDDVGEQFSYDPKSAISANVKEFKPWSGAWWMSLVKGVHHVQYRGILWRMATEALEDSVKKSS